MYVKNKEDLKKWLENLAIRETYNSLKKRNTSNKPIDVISFFDDFISSIYHLNSLEGDVLAIEEFIESKINIHQDGSYYLSRIIEYYQLTKPDARVKEIETYEIDELLVTIQDRLFPKSSIQIENEDINENQLTTNQCVLLLENLGVLRNQLSSLPNTKKAKLISLLIGRSEKNIKTAIERIDKPPSKLGEEYKSDLEKIKKLLSFLE